MNTKRFDMGKIDIAWCPGCGNFAILNALKQALSELEIKPEKLVVVSGIGQAAKAPHYYRCNLFNGLHGRSLPVATAIKAANPELIVINESGDGCMYGEGGNHFIHAARFECDLDVLLNAQPRIQRERLEHNRRVRVHARLRLPAIQHLAFARRIESGDHSQKS